MMPCPTVPDVSGVDRRNKVCYNTPRKYLGVFVMDERNEKNEKGGTRFLLVMIIILLVAVLHELNPDFMLDFRNWLKESTGSSHSSTNSRNIYDGDIKNNGDIDEAIEKYENEIDAILEKYYDGYE